MNKKTKNRISQVIMYTLIIIMAVIIFYPLLWTLGISLNPGTSLYSASMIPEDWSFEHYVWLFTDPRSDYLT